VDSGGGLLYGVGAYGLWGLFPLFFPLLEPSGAFEILAHRMVWSLVVVAVILMIRRRWAFLRTLRASPKVLGMGAAAAVAISGNWALYIWAVNSGHVVEAALGYFINPLVSIGLGVVLLRERLRPLQWTAVAIGVAAVVVLTIGYGRPPWIAFGLALSFGTYGLLKKKVPLQAVESFGVETAVAFVPAMAFLVVLQVRGDGTFTSISPEHSLLLVSCGLVTSVPLLAFAAAARRLPLSMIGLLQYLTPLLQFTIGVTIRHETMSVEQWAGFVIVWVALATLITDGLLTMHRHRRRRRAITPESAAVD
jgi:chloramphenicol-sensitive protein RarD